MNGPFVARLAIAPVKGLALQHPDAVHLGPDGAAGDRSLFLLNESGKLFSVKNHGPLVRVAATYDVTARELEMRLPGGVAVRGPVELGDGLTADLFGRAVRAREVVGPWASALSEFTGVRLRLVRPDDPGRVLGSRKVTLLGLASVAALARDAGLDAIDPRRFRMLVNVGGCAPFDEDTWIGRDLRIGDAVVRVRSPVPRCVVPTRHPSRGERDLPVLHMIKRLRGVREGRFLDLGVHGEVVAAGTIRRGDAIVPA